MQNYILGAGGHGKVVLDAMQLAGVACAGFIDDRAPRLWAGFNVFQLNSIELTASLHIAVGNCKTRELLADQLKHANFFSVTHPRAAVAETAKVDIGTLLAAQCIVAPDAKVGRHCIINHSAVIDHDCVVGDYSHIAPLVSLGGGTVVGKGVLIGAGATVLPGIVIGDYAVVGAGAVVIKNVHSGETVVGNPAKPIKNR